MSNLQNTIKNSSFWVKFWKLQRSYSQRAEKIRPPRPGHVHMTPRTSNLYHWMWNPKIFKFWWGRRHISPYPAKVKMSKIKESASHHEVKVTERRWTRHDHPWSAPDPTVESNLNSEKIHFFMFIWCHMAGAVRSSNRNTPQIFRQTMSRSM